MLKANYRQLIPIYRSVSCLTSAPNFCTISPAASDNVLDARHDIMQVSDNDSDAQQTITGSDASLDEPRNQYADQRKKKVTSSSRDYRKQSVHDTFGSRILIDRSLIYSHNAWDHAEWDEEFEARARKKVELQASNPVENKRKFLENPHKFWSEFYSVNKDKFFRDRRWLAQEFPEIFEFTRKDSPPCQFAEVGCGVGNALFPILEENQNPALKAFGFDYADTAIDVLKSNPLYDSMPIRAEVWDLASKAGIPSCVQRNSMDFIVCIFCLSAITPCEWRTAANNIAQMLKPGGYLFLRDYGRYDMTQLRLGKGRLLEENFYVRGDGTRVYYFTNEQLEQIFDKDSFEIMHNAVDKRLLVNRKTKQEMYRCWVQLKAKKISKSRLILNHR